MKRLPVWNGARFAASALCLVAAPYLRAQAAATPPAADSAEDQQPIVLSPFVVDASSDQNGYRANSTLAGTRVRTDLKDVASSISVVTQQFLQDTGAKNQSDLLVYTPSTEVSGIRGNFTGVAGSSIAQENTANSTTRVRGLDAADNTRDYFLTDIPWDSYNVGRVDLQRGPNSFLFGVGSPAGIINTSVNDAAMKTAYVYANRIDIYGSVRNQIDFNQVIVPNVLAVRLAAVQDDEKYEQKPAFNNSKRVYGAVRFTPKIFGPDMRTEFRVKYESGDIKSNNPRQIPPGDDMSLWFTTGEAGAPFGNAGYNHIILNQFSTTNPNPQHGTGHPGQPATLPGGKNGSLWNGLALANQTRSFWPDVINYYDSSSKNTTGGTPIHTTVAQPNTDLGVRDAAGNTLGGVNQPFLPAQVPMYSSYAANIGTAKGGSTTMESIAFPGGYFYANKSLTDSSVFNFYKKLLDGPNKHEWQNWKAFNFVAEQGFFGDRLSFQYAFDHQDYTVGAEQWMAGENYAISIDINATYADGTANPNAGRPFAGNAASAPSLNYQQNQIRDSHRFSGNYDFRFSDVLGDTTLSKILGHHTFTGVIERDTRTFNNMNFAEFATTPQYTLDNVRNDANHIPQTGGLNSGRSYEWLAYLGPSLASSASPKGANLNNIQYVIQPPRSQTAWNFNANWKQPAPNWNALNESWKQSDGSYKLPSGAVIAKDQIATLPDGSHVGQNGEYKNPTAAPQGFIDPMATYTYTNYVTGAQVVGRQLDNPANYVGWSQQKIDWMFWSDPADRPSLVENANRSRYRNISQGFTWQGYFLGGDLVPVVGWRKDVITSVNTTAYTDTNTGFTSLNYNDDWANGRTDARGESKSWGAVYHFPKALMSHMPWETTFSVFYNRGSNFKPDASRLSLEGLPIPNANGKTKEYGFTITTLNDKLALKVAKFNTRVVNATLATTAGNSIGGLGANAYFIADGMIWGYGWATYLQDAMLGIGGASYSTYGDYASADGFDPNDTAAKKAYNENGGTSPNGTKYAGHKAVTAAWASAPFPTSFFSSYNLSIPIDAARAAKSGLLRDAYTTGYADNQGPNLGGGSNFGNHQTTVDNLSSGTEVELTYAPVKNWNITVNYSKVSATHENIDPVSIRFIGAMTKFLNGPGGQVREWWNGGGAIRDDWNASIVAPYTVTLNQLGHEAPEVSPWRFNLISTYQFERGPAKGVFVGGALRVEDGRIIGYQFDPNFVNANANDPDYAGVPAALTHGGLNINKPFRGATEHHVDAWVGYSKKIRKDVNWRIQLNIRSVGEKDRTMAAGMNPDGQVSLARIVQGMGYQLENTFEF